MHTSSDYQRNEEDDANNNRELLIMLRELLSSSQSQSSPQNELIICLLEKIARQSCAILNEAHWQTELQKQTARTLESFYQIYKTVHPAEAAQYERIAQLEAELEKCCPKKEPEPICKFVPCEKDGTQGDGSSMKSRSYVNAVDFTEEQREPWQIVHRALNDEDENLPVVAQGSIFGKLVPSKPTPKVQDFRSGGAPIGSQEPVGFRTFTNTALAANWPPDMSGAKGGDVVLMSGNLWLKISVDSGKTFTDIDWTKLFDLNKDYGNWSGDQVVHYIPQIDCFVLYVQSSRVTSGVNMNKNIVKIALASQADLKKYSGGRKAWWRQWDFIPETFGLGSSWMDFPDISFGDNFLHVNTNVFAGVQGKLFYELPLADMVAGRGFGFLYAFISDEGKLNIGSPIQNIAGDQNYWAAHVDNSTMRVYASLAGDPNFSWRDRKVANWPKTSDNNIISAAPDNSDWISEDHRIIGATRVNNLIWFAWTAATDLQFPHPHVQIAKFDITQDFKLVEQTQVWNPDHAFAYPSLTTNSNNEVGISLSWGGSVPLKYFGNHAVGILGDFVVWFGEASNITLLRQQVNPDGTLAVDGAGNSIMAPTRWGDYVHVRLAHPDKRFFSAFGYAVLDDPATVAAPNKGRFDYLYVEFGREAVAPSPVR